MEKKESVSLKVSDGRIPPRIVSVTTVKGGYLAPVVKGTSGVEGNSLVTWSGLAVKSASKTSKRPSAHPKVRLPYRRVAGSVGSTL